MCWKGHFVLEARTVGVNSAYYQEEGNGNVELSGSIGQKMVRQNALQIRCWQMFLG